MYSAQNHEKIHIQTALFLNQFFDHQEATVETSELE